jgi:hypothetical protein
MLRLPQAPSQYRVPAKMKVHKTDARATVASGVSLPPAVGAVYDKTRGVLFKAQLHVGIGSSSLRSATQLPCTRNTQALIDTCHWLMQMVFPQ